MYLYILLIATGVSPLEDVIGSELERSCLLDLHKSMGKFGMRMFHPHLTTTYCTILNTSVVASMVIESDKVIFAATTSQRILLSIVFANVSYSFANVGRYSLST